LICEETRWSMDWLWGARDRSPDGALPQAWGPAASGRQRRGKLSITDRARCFLAVGQWGGCPYRPLIAAHSVDVT
jgi:hypothetical protein